MSPPEGARRTGMFVAICSDPDYAWTPIGGKKKLVPYMIACDLSGSQAVSPDSFFAGDPVFLFKTSQVPRVEGNEPGVGDGPGTSGIDERGNGGLLSGVNNGIVWVEQNAKNVFVNGIEVVRHEDGCWMNHKPVKE
jgi:hypothetical protein